MASELVRDLRLLLRPRIAALGRGGGGGGAARSRLRPAALALLGAGFWAGIFLVSHRVLAHFRGIEEIGDILAFKLLSMILIVCFALLLFSGILTSLSRLFLSQDLSLVHALPLAGHRIFLARWIDSTAESSWMVIVYALPVFGAAGIVFEAGWLYYAVAALALGLLALGASAVSAAMVLGAVMLVPASRLRNLVVLLGVALFVGLYIAVRLMRPEQLVNPEVFDSVMAYIATLQAPAAPWLPTTWAHDALRAALSGQGGRCLLHLGLLASFAGALLCGLALASEALYFRGFSRTQTVPPRRVRTARGQPGRRLRRRLRLPPGPLRAFAVKEILTFRRDQTQWTQLFLIAALVVIYLYNFKALPLERSPVPTAYLENLFAFLNMALALFVLTAVAARFAYPAVSMEREAIWFVRSAPVPLGAFLRMKFLIYYLPLLLLTELLVVATNLLLRVTPFMMVLSTATVFLLVPGVVALAVGLGAAFPDFTAENPAQTVTSFGGLLFMTASAALIGLAILLEAGPVYRIVLAEIHGRALSTAALIWAAVAFAAVVLLGVLAAVLPLRYGARRLSG